MNKAVIIGATEYQESSLVPVQVQANMRTLIGLTDKQKSELRTSMRSRAEIPLKFEYFGKGAKRFDALFRSDEYRIASLETKIITNNLDEIDSLLSGKSMNIIDVGCGNGLKALPLVQHFSQKFTPVIYAPVDISKSMLRLAIDNVGRLGSKVEIIFDRKESIVDFEKDNLSDIAHLATNRLSRDNLFLFLGHTLGNARDLSARKNILRHLLESMNEQNDLLLVGVELSLDKATQNVLAQYRSKLMFELVSTVLDGLGATHSRSWEDDFRVEFDVVENGVVGYFVPRHPVEIRINGRFVTLAEGNPIRLVTSHKFSSIDELLNLMKDAGFYKKKAFMDDQKMYAVVACSCQ